MKNIDYLELFFRKHKLSGQITVKYQDSRATDMYMTDIVFPNGDVININDVIFDIDSELVEDVVEQWLEYKRTNDISLVDWMQTNNHYTPKNVDTSSIDEYHKELDDIMEDVKNNINKVFEMEVDEDEDE